MMADDGRVVLMDFGTGRELDDDGRLARRHPALPRARALRRRQPERGERRLQPRRAALSPAHRRRIRCGGHLRRSPSGARARRARAPRARAPRPSGEARSRASIARSIPTPRAAPDPRRCSPPSCAAGRGRRGRAIARRLDRGGRRAARARRGMGDPRAATGRPLRRAPVSAAWEPCSASAAASAAIAEPTLVVLPFDDLGERAGRRLLRRRPRRRDHPRPGAGRRTGGAVALLLVHLPRRAARSPRRRRAAGSEPRRHRLGPALGRPAPSQRAARRPRSRSPAVGRTFRPRAPVLRRRLRDRRRDRAQRSSTSCGSPWAPVSGATTWISTSTIAISRRARWSERRGIAEPTRAVVMLDQILADDPTFAPALRLRWRTPTASVDASPTRVERQSRRGARADAASGVRALELDPMLAEAHAAMGVVTRRERSWRESPKSPSSAPSSSTRR